MFIMHRLLCCMLLVISFILCRSRHLGSGCACDGLAKLCSRADSQREGSPPTVSLSPLPSPFPLLLSLPPHLPLPPPPPSPSSPFPLLPPLSSLPSPLCVLFDTTYMYCCSCCTLAVVSCLESPQKTCLKESGERWLSQTRT